MGSARIVLMSTATSGQSYCGHTLTATYFPSRLTAMAGLFPASEQA